MAHAIDTLTRALVDASARTDDTQAALDHLERVEDILKSIAMTMAGHEDWDADMLEFIADVIGANFPHPGEYGGYDEETQTGPAERYIHDMSEAGFVVYMSDIADAQSIDVDNGNAAEGED